VLVSVNIISYSAAVLCPCIVEIWRFDKSVLLPTKIFLLFGQHVVEY